MLFACRRQEWKPLIWNELVIKTAELMRFKAHEKGIAFKLQLDNSKFQMSNSKLDSYDLEFDIWNLELNTPLSIKADFNLMEQVLINIIKNAIEAIGQNGVIIFRTTAKPLQLFIEDTGRGIAKDIENQLFTPFFTTKTYGQGVGLTLIREILTAHNFDFALYRKHPDSYEHEGVVDLCKTVFRIRFN